MKIKNILIFGASGRTGKYVADYCLSKGYHVTALVRSPEKFQTTSENLTLIKGSPYDLSNVLHAMQHCDAVINVLNNPRKSDSPFAKQEGPIDVVEHSISNAINAMNHYGITRLIHMSAFGVGNSFKNSGLVLKLMIKWTNLKIAYADHEKAEKLLSNTSLEWTIVRPAALSDDIEKSNVFESHGGNSLPGFPFPSISRMQVGKFLADSVERTELFYKTVEICKQ